MLILNDENIYRSREQLYIAVRDKEGRVYSDEVLRILPDVDMAHPLYNEWQQRKKSYERLQQHIKSKYKNEKIAVLDLGCGNGWMSNLLHKAEYNVTGADLNMAELTQGERVFGTNGTLQWIYGDVMNAQFPYPYDVIVLAASCQYFAELPVLIERLKSMTQANGEIHLIDSMFYRQDEVAGAAARSRAYYSGLGYPDMAKYYHHHSKEDLMEMGFECVYPRAYQLFVKGLQWWLLRC
jgi:2-polyprenyl-3-methyl-5-hydroxy-6-metoxy-1,4-benzoquinol methylase